MLFKRMLCLLCALQVHAVFATAIIDGDVARETSLLRTGASPATSLSLLVFLRTDAEKAKLLTTLHALPGVRIQPLGFMPAVAVAAPRDAAVVQQIAQLPGAAQISLYKPGAVELDVNSQILKLTPSPIYPDVDTWWAHGYTGKHGVVGILDTGIDTSHPALAQKHVVLRKEEGSGYADSIDGVKEPHGTGVACIYASNDGKYKGMAYGATDIVAALAGAETADTASFMQTLSSLDWMLNRSHSKPSIINYSMGNGALACPACPAWSGLAKVIDYVINTHKILLVKSAGNMGYIAPTNEFPFASTLTVPGDNYNGLTVANMNANVISQGITTKVVDRQRHRIKETSSRGPTPNGRRKPDVTAPGHDTRTCAPDPTYYHFNYTHAMDYKDGYRLMGGTSAAAPHVGAAVLLLQEAGIREPMAAKALLINSADTWTDWGQATGSHQEIMGSAWNRTYGWGYLNMEKAFAQRNNRVQAALTLENPRWEITTTLQPGDKVTLVHERRVGYAKDGQEWQLSHLMLEILDATTHEPLDKDASPIDSVHQVSYCQRKSDEKTCTVPDGPRQVLVRVTLLSNALDGSNREPFALVAGSLSTY